jgi:hexosaminidase
MTRPAALALFVAVSFVSCAKPVRVAQPGPAPSLPAAEAAPGARAGAQAAPAHAVIPIPASIVVDPGAGFVFTPETRIAAPAGDDQALWIAKWLAAFIGQAAGPKPPDVLVVGGPGGANTVELALGGVAAAGDEGYELTVTPERVRVVAGRAAGLFYGVQTLRQLLPAFVEHEAVLADQSRPVSVPAVRIADTPRYGWRGAMLDVSRHFLGVDAVKRYIDLMALYKLNRLHLHLSDDQGWRIEIKSWPNLAKHGGSTQVGGGPGGYYTQEQYADIVAYAQQRFITVVPEIDMPGHTNAALASYPELNCNGQAPPLYTGIEVGFSALCVDKDVTYRFIDDVVREIGALTTGPYFHMGGDEVKTLNEAQYAQFVERVQAIVQARGKTVVGWDEIAAARLGPGVIVQHWRPENVPAAAVAKGVKVILSPANKIYLDMKYHPATILGLNWAGYVDVPDAYSWDPLTMFQGLTEAAIAGVEAPLWAETLAHLHDFEQMAFPRLAGVAEIAWSRADQRTWDEYKVRLGAHGARWTSLGVTFYRSPTVPWGQ